MKVFLLTSVVALSIFVVAFQKFVVAFLAKDRATTSHFGVDYATTESQSVVALWKKVTSDATTFYSDATTDSRFDLESDDQVLLSERYADPSCMFSIN